MAATLAEIYPKRRMEDIGSRHKKAKLESKSFYVPTQERLPSPSFPSSSLSPHRPHQRQKSVLFELSRNEHFECPLLTPKDEDYGVDSDRDEDKPQEEEDVRALDTNVDYISLESTASLLALTKERVESEIAELSVLRKQAQKASKLDLVDFYVRLIYEKQSLPGQHRIVRAPEIDWARYGEGLANVSLHYDCTNEKRIRFSRQCACSNLHLENNI